MAVGVEGGVGIGQRTELSLGDRNADAEMMDVLCGVVQRISGNEADQRDAYAEEA